MPVLGLTVAGFISRHFSGFKAVFLKRTLSWPYDFD
jgi:hypothetical protein